MLETATIKTFQKRPFRRRRIDRKLTVTIAMHKSRFSYCCILGVVYSIAISSTSRTEELNPSAGFNLTLNQLFDRKTLSCEADAQTMTFRYRLFIPAEAKLPEGRSKKWPMILWLHGAGEAGDDNEMHLRWMENLFHSYANKRQFPAIVVAYQCPRTHAVWDYSPAGSGTIAELKAIAEDVIRLHAVDTNRVYVAGVSSGASGCWKMLVAYPDFFAGSLIMASSGYTGNELSRIVDVPIWAFHVYRDPDTSIRGVRSTVSRLESLGGKVWLTEVPGYSHDCWTMAADRYKAVQWLLAQQKGNGGPLPTHRDFGVTLQLVQQEIAATSLQYYLLLPAIGAICWWTARRQISQRRNKPITIDDNSPASDPPRAL